MKIGMLGSPHEGHATRIKASGRIAMVDTAPVDMRNSGSVNLGLEIVAERLKADVYHWRDVLRHPYEVIAVNAFFPPHVLNLPPFLRRNSIEPLREKRHQQPYIIIGGQGASILSALDDIVDETFMGELDGNFKDKHGWVRQRVLDSHPLIKGRKAVIELTRGCKYRCTFCEYGWRSGGPYREKALDVVKAQIKLCRNEGIRNVNFLSANLAGYKDIDGLFEFCCSQGVNVLNSDFCPQDVLKAFRWLGPAKIRTVKLGLESFDEATRLSVGKRITDAELRVILDKLLETCSYLHFYMIFGLPHDDYGSWMKWAKYLMSLRRRYDRKLRFEFDLTNLTPCKGTPLASAPPVDYTAKDRFLKRWIGALLREGWYKRADGVVTYATGRGRLGLKEMSYRLILALRNGGVELTPNILHALPRGVGRSVSDKEARRFLEYQG